MNETHLNFLIQIGDNEQEYVGNNSLNWATSILPNNNLLDNYLDRQFNRYELFDFCQNPNNENLNVLIAILSWGGMRRNHGRLLFNNLNFVLGLVDNMRKGIYQTRHLNCTGFEAEKRIFSYGRHKGQWRNYLIENYNN